MRVTFTFEYKDIDHFRGDIEGLYHDVNALVKDATAVEESTPELTMTLYRPDKNIAQEVIDADNAFSALQELKVGTGDHPEVPFERDTKKRQAEQDAKDEVQRKLARLEELEELFAKNG